MKVVRLVEGLHWCGTCGCHSSERKRVVSNNGNLPKKVLVTGGAGFIGSHVVDALVRAGHEVAVLDNLETGFAANVPAGVVFVRANILSIRSQELAEMVSGFHPDCILHFAANPSVAESTLSPLADMHANIRGTVNVLDAAVHWECKHIVFASTCAVYGNAGKQPVKEDTLLDPISPYGISKMAAERYVEYYSRKWRMPATILRFSNVYGPRQRPEAGVVARWCRTMAEVDVEAPDIEKMLTIYGDGKSVRDYLYIDDAVSAVMLAVKNATWRYLNVGTGIPTTLNELFMCTMLAGPHRDFGARFAPRRGDDVDAIVLDHQKITGMFGWRPTVSLIEGLRRTMEWHQQQVQASRSPVFQESE